MELISHSILPLESSEAIFPPCQIEGKAVPPPLAVSIITLLSSLLPDWKLVPLPADSGDGLVRDPLKRREVAHDPIVYKGKPRLQTAVQLLQAGMRVGSLLHQVSICFSGDGARFHSLASGEHYLLG